jgi:hypothetical protein
VGEKVGNLFVSPSLQLPGGGCTVRFPLKRKQSEMKDKLFSIRSEIDFRYEMKRKKAERSERKRSEMKQSETQRNKAKQSNTEKK